MEAFLFWIGWYNVLGSVVLMAMHDERVARFVLTKATEAVSTPYEHGQHGRLFVWWAGTANAFLGAIMVLATRWPAEVQREVAIAVVVLYAAMYIVCTIGGRNPQWGRGRYSIHVLWPAQMAWGIWALIV